MTILFSLVLMDLNIAFQLQFYLTSLPYKIQLFNTTHGSSSLFAQLFLFAIYLKIEYKLFTKKALKAGQVREWPTKAEHGSVILIKTNKRTQDGENYTDRYLYTCIYVGPVPEVLADYILVVSFNFCP